MEKSFYVAGNWKMNLTAGEGAELVRNIVDAWPEPKERTHLLCFPPYTHLAATSLLAGKTLEIGAQDCSANNHNGAFTGEVSAHMIASTGAKWVILGHSERRQYHNENDQLLTQKMKQAAAANLGIIFCCGEPLEIREKGDAAAEEFVLNQLNALNNESARSRIPTTRLLIAYEPIWAIGTGRVASPEQAQSMCCAIQEWTIKHLGVKPFEIPVLYGGSCNPKNARDLFSKPHISGGLIGGASLKANDFIEIARIANECTQNR